MSETERIAVCPGSYDPVTNGHPTSPAALRVFDRSWSGWSAAPAQVGPPVHPGGSAELVEDAVARNETENVEVRIFAPLVEFARECGATIVKGLRDPDFEYEFEMNQPNRTLAEEIESVYILACPATASSARAA